jgi:Holliday junction DNA helicase RuvA
VGGVGLRVFVPERFLDACGSIGSTVSLHTYLHVREAGLTLYGCATDGELKLFRLLLSVSGVGPKVALSMLDTLSDEELRSAIANEQAEVLSRVPGIGPKTAKKVVFELKDKVGVSATRLQPAILEEDGEVIAALTALGYSIVEAQTALQRVPATVRGVEERLRAALTAFGG